MPNSHANEIDNEAHLTAVMETRARHWERYRHERCPDADCSQHPRPLTDRLGSIDLDQGFFRIVEPTNERTPMKMKGTNPPTLAEERGRSPEHIAALEEYDLAARLVKRHQRTWYCWTTLQCRVHDPAVSAEHDQVIADRANAKAAVVIADTKPSQ